MDDVLALQVVQRQRHLTEVESNCVLAELDVLLQVVAEVSSQQEVHNHEHILLVLERVPGCSGMRRPSVTAQCGKTHAAQTTAKTEHTRPQTCSVCFSCRTQSALHVQILSDTRMLMRSTKGRRTNLHRSKCKHAQIWHMHTSQPQHNIHVSCRTECKNRGRHCHIKARQ